MDDHTLPVSEVFGPTLQGEGPFAGRTVVFVRLGGCNLACSWCDSPYTWDATRYNLRAECPPQSVEQIMQRLHTLNTRARIVILTGGEPLLHQKNTAFHQLLAALGGEGYDVHVETNGTVEPTIGTYARVAHFSVSPKLPNAGEHKRSQNPDVWTGWDRVEHAAFKFVVETPDDVTEAHRRATLYGIPPARTWVMPEGTSTDVLQARWPAIARAAADLGINATHRLHVLAWGDQKGT